MVWAYPLTESDSMASQPDAITRFFRACEPNLPLEPEDPRYVNCDAVRGDSLVETHARALYRADPTRPETRLFAGHRGVGKTSELLRLKKLLEKPPKEQRPFKVVYFDVSQSLDPNDLDFPDLLVFAASQVQQQLRQAGIPGFTATSQLLSKVWTDITGLLSLEIIPSEAEVSTPFAALTLELKNRPSARGKLRAAIEAQSTSLLQAVNDLLTMATVRLRESGSEGLVLIIDGLDKLVLRPLEGGSNTHIRLFCDRADQLTSLKAHVIYTVPISLFYSPRCGQLEQSFGEFNVPVPMIRLRGDNRSKITPESAGMSIMWEMIEARCGYADVSLSELFDSRETGNYVCQMTGGHPRHLMMLLQSAVNAVDSLPITKAAAEKAVRNYANSLFREIPDRFWPKLRKFAEPQEDIPKDEDHQEMLFLLHVFEYMNGQPWYEVNPVIRTLPKFRAAARTKHGR
jgi:hypothetical protein